MKTLITIVNTKTKVFHRLVLNKGTITAQTKMSTETFYKTVKWLRPRLTSVTSQFPSIIKDTSIIPSHVSITIDNLYGT